MVPKHLAMAKSSHSAQSHNPFEIMSEVDASPELFTYLPLAESNSIRLVILHPGQFGDSVECHIVTFDTKEPSPPPFEALSYVWGDPGNTV
jgi:hypothetical protein